MNRDDFPSDEIEVYNDFPYTGYVQDLGFGWRWRITSEGTEIQQGCALSRDSARHHVTRVIDFFRQRHRRMQQKSSNREIND